MSRDCHDPLSLSPLHLSTSPVSSRLTARAFLHLRLLACFASRVTAARPLSRFEFRFPRSTSLASSRFRTGFLRPLERRASCQRSAHLKRPITTNWQVRASFAVAGFGSPRRFASGSSLRDCWVAYLAACTMLNTPVTCSLRLSSRGQCARHRFRFEPSRSSAVDSLHRQSEWFADVSGIALVSLSLATLGQYVRGLEASQLDDFELARWTALLRP